MALVADAWCHHNFLTTETLIMQIITNSEITKALCDVNPTHIAVAYVGIDWRDYIDEDNLKEIIISPTLGSNPRAIAEIALKLRWENVHFLDALHAKFYIGNSKAAIGSFNLSKNGIGADGLEELGVITDDMAHIAQLKEKEFSRLKDLAHEKYSNIEAKKSRLKELDKMSNRAGIMSKNTPLLTIEEYVKLDYKNIWIMWYEEIAPEKDFGAIGAYDINLRNENLFEKEVVNWTSVLEEDKIEPGSWVLMWLIGKEGKPNLKKNPYWLYVDDAIPNILKNVAHTKILLQRRNEEPRTAPFDLNQKGVKAALFSTLSEDEFSAFRWTGQTHWSAQSCVSDTKRLLDAVVNKLSQNP